MNFPHWYVSAMCWSGMVIGTSAAIAGAFWAFGCAMVYVQRVLEVEAIVFKAIWAYAREKSAAREAKNAAE